MAYKFDIDQVIGQLHAVRKTGKQAVLSETLLRQLCTMSRELFLKEKNLVEVPTPVHIFGDIHGQFTDLLRHFDQLGFPSDTENQNYLFLGDYVDRGQYSLETICLLMAYKVKYPERMHLLRGNHECASINRIYGFYDECKRRFNIKLWKTFTDCFNCLPIAAVVDSTVFCVHGGLSPDLKDFNEIRNMERPMEIPDFGLAADLLWSDPDEVQPVHVPAKSSSNSIAVGLCLTGDKPSSCFHFGGDITGWGENDRGVSWTFGADIVQSFLLQNKLSLVARGHQVVEDGYQFFQKRKLVTLFSAPNYCGEFDNAGAVMSISDTLLCTFSILKPNSIAEFEASLEKKKKK